LYKHFSVRLSSFPHKYMYIMYVVKFIIITLHNPKYQEWYSLPLDVEHAIIGL